MNIKAYSFEQNTHAFAEVKRAVSEQLTEPGMYFESYSDAKALFTALYQALIGKDQGPRLASFMKIIGKDKLAKILSVY